ncbi:MAG: polysaccharide deacetylase family protein [Nitrososphaerota archaeon]|nr:polysaccharide deacetylase family protein [Nitrososphaerota archaeon]
MSYNNGLKYSSILERKKVSLPFGARIAVLFVINVENWYLEAPARSILASPAGVRPEIDVPNYAWHDYGMRVGFWRMKSALEAYDVKPTVALNGSVCDAYPKVAEGCKEDGWEIIGHGFTQKILPTEEDEEAAIVRTKDAIHSFYGRAPRGWLGPGLAETRDTLRFLTKHGFEYTCDWANDDQPYKMTVEGRYIWSVPYPLELNDIVIFANQHHSANEFYLRAKESFDRLYQEGKQNPRVLAIAVHPYISGVPHRINTFERILEYTTSHKNVWKATASEILDAFKDGV